MTLQRIFIVFAIILFGGIGVLAFKKKQSAPPPSSAQSQVAVVAAPSKGKGSQRAVFEGQPIEIDIKTLQSIRKPVSNTKNAADKEIVAVKEEVKASEKKGEEAAPVPLDSLPDVDRMDLLFQKDSPLPIVETISYTSRVSWKRGKSAWLIDYASHYNTPIDFIARSINGAAHYTIGSISEGQRFNVLRGDREFYFYLVIDTTRCKLWLYYVDPQEQESALLKTYRVGLGRLAPEKASGILTPVGTYKLGNRVAVFKPKMMGWHKNKRVELMRVFGTRWIPFEREIQGCSEPAKGYGIHGTPWVYDEQKQALVDGGSGIGGYQSDGCIRLATPDLEELYSIITTRETVLQIVTDVHQAKLPYGVQ